MLTSVLKGFDTKTRLMGHFSMIHEPCLHERLNEEKALPAGSTVGIADHDVGPSVAGSLSCAGAWECVLPTR